MGEKIKMYLDSNGIKYKSVAEKAGIAYAAFSMVMTGKRRLQADEYFRVCEALGVPVDFFAEK